MMDQTILCIRWNKINVLHGEKTIFHPVAFVEEMGKLSLSPLFSQQESTPSPTKMKN
jgi:hypothetical protein